MSETKGRRAGLGQRGENVSVMVPTYNCAALLRETLQSLKDQGESLADAQIEVIDDVSTKDDPEATKFVLRQLSHAAALLRDLTYTAWIESGKRPVRGDNPTLPSHPSYDPQTGTSAPVSAAPYRPAQAIPLGIEGPPEMNLPFGATKRNHIEHRSWAAPTL